MNPFFFGTGSRRLFGVFHPPESQPRLTGVVLCQPLFREYLLAHRAMRVLACNLAKLGYPVLRFDYYGCGDSAGECKDVRLASCCENIRTAVAELTETSGTGKIALVGLRIGGTLAARVAAEIPAVKQLILWDPVIHGSIYLDELRELHQKRTGIWPNENSTEGIDGFEMSAAICDDLAGICMSAVDRYPNDRVYLVNQGSSPDLVEVTTGWATRGIQATTELIEGPRVWTARTDDSNELVPAATLAQIAQWIENQ